MNTKQLSSKVLLAALLIFGITACQQNPDEIPQFIEPVTYQTSIDEMPELGPFIGKFLGTSKRSTENIPEVNGGNHYSDLVDKIDFDYILARMDTSGQTYMSMSIANDDPKVIQNLVIGKDVNENLLTPMIFTYTMDDDFYEVYRETGSLDGFSGHFERVTLTPYAYEQNESAANIAQFRSSTSTDCPDETAMEPNTNDDRTTSTRTSQEGTSGGTGTSACTYELQIIGEICTETINERGEIVATDCSPRWGNVMVCPDDANEYSSSDDPCENPNSGEVPVVNLFLMYPEGSDYHIRFPKFTKYLSTSLHRITQIPKVMDALLEYSCMSREEIKENLTWGHSGPEIHIVEIDGVEGFFNENYPNIINLNENLVNEFEQADDPNVSNGLLFYLGVTVLHEYVHFGIFNGGCTNYEWEEGWAFEEMAYGEHVTRSKALIRYKND